MTNLLFAFKKLLEFAIFPPGIIIIAFLIIAYLARKTKLASIFSLFCAFCVYSLSIQPVSNYLLKPLESAYTQPKTLKADCIVVLSASSYNSKTLDADSLNRLVSGYTHDSIHFVKHHSSSLTKFPSACSVSCPQRGAAVGSEA
jgi:hypothetical protein